MELIAGKLESDGALGFTNDLGRGLSEIWQKLGVSSDLGFVGVCNYKRQQLVLFVATAATDACSYYMIHNCQSLWVFKFEGGKLWRVFW